MLVTLTEVSLTGCHSCEWRYRIATVRINLYPALAAVNSHRTKMWIKLWENMWTTLN